ncbi:hypothetical protein CTEN210_06695 [Chaetoceros tenuissimus]|uniref:G-protein coupled receptors family 1 profile domain-containing protein n=1 Tax=Chaetoceros tenuissimus TaxID=426638 RepID=A0AAD3CT94_9STRA|nr:hypothetical protein CTEN210_06695 [Chaetoceros tenuissimus]
MRESSKNWLENNANNTGQHSQDYFYYSEEAAVMTITSGSLSTMSSLLIILIILRSRTKLTSSYHRIMLFMSISDIFASVPITLATLPMPSDVLYPFATLAMGNMKTCSAQAFFIILGQVCAVLSNVILNLYYLLKFRYNKSDDFIKKKLEPVGYTLSVIIGLTSAAVALAFNMLNPTPYVPFCFAGSYPFDCLMDDEVECIAGRVSQKEETIFKIIYLSIIGCAFFAVLISMVLVILSVFKTRRDSRKRKEEMQRKGRNAGTASSERQYYDDVITPETSNPANALELGEDRNLENTNSVMKVALMYIMAFFLTWIWSIIAVAAGSFSNWGNILWIVLDRAKPIFNPAQGLFNLFIFVYNKVHILRKGSTEAMSFCEALKIVITKPKEVPEFLIPSLDMVDLDIRTKRQERKDLERSHEMIERDMAEDQRINDEMIEQDQDLSFPNSSSSEFISIDTPSIQMSAAVSSYGFEERALDKDVFLSEDLSIESSKHMPYYLQKNSSSSLSESEYSSLK